MLFRSQAKALCELRQQWRAAGANVEFLIKEELKAHLQSDRYCGALYCRDGGTIHPFAYASALADEAIKAGAALFEASPAKSIKPDGGKWIVKTPGGEIRADCVAICTNAYGGAVWPGLDRAFYRIKMAMIASDPLSSETLRRLPHRTPFADVGSIAIFGGMIDAQSRLVASVFAGFVRNGDPARLALGFDAQFRKTFPGVQTPAWTQSWMGDLCVTPDRTPKLLNLAPGVAAAIGYSGAGIALSGALGRTLFQYLTEPKSCRFPISQLSRAPMSSVIPFALTRIAAPASRMIQQL